MCHKIIKLNAIGNQEDGEQELQQNGENNKIIAICDNTSYLYKIQVAVLFEKALDKFSGLYAE